MAGDWIKMRENLHEEPEVLQMASILETRPEHVVGYCHRFWGWVSRNVSPTDRDKCPGGCVTGVPLVSVEAVLNLPGFLSMMCEVGWLEYENNGQSHIITVPDMDKHLSQTAKQRAVEADKKRRQRTPKMSRTHRDKCPAPTGTREEKRREENNTPLTPQGGKRKKFVPPTLAEVGAYIEGMNYHFDPEDFIAYYSSQSWKKKNGQPVSDWKGCCRTFESNWKRTNPEQKIPEPHCRVCKEPRSKCGGWVDGECSTCFGARMDAEAGV